MAKHTVVFYKSYNQWHVTVPFEDPEKAKRHAELYLKTTQAGTPFENNKDYITNITFHDVELPDD